ncbi:MAG: RlmE family RNA methyltransferase [Promethearchaeota archaeon]|nr:MAG: RlmE family RNA methyltransferase [Candidatus Lokiarchaeota archaeon]
MAPNPHGHSKERFYKKAKSNGYRARSAYKLIGIQNRFNIFKRAFYILDIGSTPGSWLQVAQKYAEENLEKYNDQYYHREDYKIMGVDLKRVSPIENVTIVKMDVTKPEFRDELEAFFDGPLDLLLSDASIKKSGNKFSDQVKQFRLCHQILQLARDYLKYKGHMVIKVFQGADFDKFYRSMKREFRTVKAFKPKASKKSSNEMFLVGLKKK